MYIIAEIGINHNGDLQLAKDMISEAKACGADAVKFQKRKIGTVYTSEFLNSPRETPPGSLVKLPFGGTTQGEQKEALEFTAHEYDLIDLHCETVDIHWFASAWDIESLHFLEQYTPPFHKIASPMVTNLDFIHHVARMEPRIILSTGMSLPTDIRQALDIIERENKRRPVLMHCVSEYPTPPERTYLLEIKALADYGYEVGYSGHESGTTPTLTAVGVGATYVERHFTLDRAMYGSDQAASLEPDGFRRIAACARIAEQCLHYRPDGHITAQEKENARKLRYWESV